MFKKDNNGVSGSFDTLVGVNTVFEGNIESEGTVRIDGKVKGDLKIAGDVYIGPDATIKGNISGNNVLCRFESVLNCRI
jgi:cytoskeletal protein CcmA (bactofilin family)